MSQPEVPEIPAVFHRIMALGYDPGPEAHRWWARFAEIHPGWEMRSWVDPFDPADWELGRLFASCRSGAQLADLLRLEILWREGGVYVDCDVEPLSSFEPLRRHGCVVGTQDGIKLTNSVIAAAPGHGFVRALIDRLLELDTLPESPGPDVVTGPHLLTRVAEEQHDILVVPRPVFYPVRPGLPDDNDAIDRHALCIHHWFETWKDDAAPERHEGLRRGLRRRIGQANAGSVYPALRRVATHVAPARPTPSRGAGIHEGAVLVTTAGGFAVWVPVDSPALASLLTSGIHPRVPLEVLEDIVRPGDWVLDLEPDFGLLAIAAGRAAHRQGRVVLAVEDESAVPVLERNRTLAASASTAPWSLTPSSSSEAEDLLPTGVPVRLTHCGASGRAWLLAIDLLENDRADHVIGVLSRRDIGERWDEITRRLESMEHSGMWVVRAVDGVGVSDLTVIRVMEHLGPVLVSWRGSRR